jgi:hypothetical protein
VRENIFHIRGPILPQICDLTHVLVSTFCPGITW